MGTNNAETSCSMAFASRMERRSSWRGIPAGVDIGGARNDKPASAWAPSAALVSIIFCTRSGLPRGNTLAPVPWPSPACRE
ncbi:hypothetical protein DFQ26_001711, partial [Actinomortierella ambigua]